MQRIGAIKHVYENGQLQVVEDDVLHIVSRMRALSPRLAVYWNEHIGQFTITETTLDGSEERLVMNVAQLDERVLDRLQVADQWRGNDTPEHILPEDEDFLTRFEKMEEQIEKEKDELIRGRVSEVVAPLASYMGLDGRGTKASIWVPRDVS
jgi:hypothetical protein